jgi:hypothetical protein
MRGTDDPLKTPTAARTHKKDVLLEHLAHHGDRIELRATKSTSPTAGSSRRP